MTTATRTDTVRTFIEAHADELFAQGAEAERLGRLTDETVRLLREAEAMRMLQPAEYGGLEYRPRAFAENVMRLASLDPAAGLSRSRTSPDVRPATDYPSGRLGHRRFGARWRSSCRAVTTRGAIRRCSTRSI